MTQALEASLYATTPGRIAGTAIQVADRTDSTPAKADGRALRPTLEQAIRRLRAIYRRCIMLRYAEERSYDSIGEILHLPVGTVASYLHRARRELRSILA